MTHLTRQEAMTKHNVTSWITQLESYDYIDDEGYESTAWRLKTAPVISREEQIAKDVAESIARTNSTIFGYTWEEIQAKQQRK